MKRILIYVLILILGIGIGYVLNNAIQTPSKNSRPSKKIYVNQIKKQIVKDTIIVEKIINTTSTEAPEDSDTELENFNDADSISIDNMEDDSNIKAEMEDTEDVIIQEKKIGQRTVHLDPLLVDSTDVEAILGVKSNAFSKEINIEFWQSPLNLTGYVLTRNKLKLFGFNPNENISLHISKDGEHLFLNTNTMSISLEKTEEFINLMLK